MLSKGCVQLCGTWNEAQDENLGFMSVKFYQLATLSSIKHSADTVKDEDPVTCSGWESWAGAAENKGARLR